MHTSCGPERQGLQLPVRPRAGAPAALQRTRMAGVA